MIYFLYAITNLINGKQYYGWAKDYKRRWVEHRCGHGSKLVYQATQKYGLVNFRFEILCEGSEKEVKDLEQIMIQENFSKAPYGYNLTDGGEGNTGWKASTETKKKMSVSHTGVRNSMYGRKHNKETKEKIRQKAKGRPMSEASRKVLLNNSGAKNPRARKILVNGIKYDCIKDAAISEGIKPSYLRLQFSKYLKNNNFPNGWGYLTPREKK